MMLSCGLKPGGPDVRHRDDGQACPAALDPGSVRLGAGLVPARQQEDRQLIEPFEDGPIRCSRRIGSGKGDESIPVGLRDGRVKIAGFGEKR
jgi:hypothetical protein